MSVEEIVKTKILNIQEEFCRRLRKKYILYPFICEWASNFLLAYLSHVLEKEGIDIDGLIHFGWYTHPTNSDICSYHSWIQIGDLLIDPTYEQFDESYKDRVRIEFVFQIQETEYKTYSTDPVINRFIKRVQNTNSLKEFLDKFQGRLDISS